VLNQFINVVAGVAPAALALACLTAWAAAGATPAQRRPLWRALLFGSAAGLVGGVAVAALRASAILTDREVVALATLAPLALSEIGLLVLVWRRRSGPVLTGTVALVAGLINLRAWPGVVLNWADRVLPGQSVLTTDSLSRLTGFLAGAGLLVLTVLALTRAAAGLSRTWAAVVLTVGWGLTWVSQLVTIVQFLQARRLVRLPRPAFRGLVWAVNHQSWVLFGLIGLTALLALSRWRAARRPSGLSTALDEARPAEIRLARARARRQGRWMAVALGAVALIGLTVTALAAWEARKPELSPPEPFEIVAGQAVIPLAAVDDGHLHRFAHTTADGTEVRFIIIRKNGVAYGVGLDACEICGPTGYIEIAGRILCRLCDVIMNIATIGFKGGCNPIPLDHSVIDGAIVIQVADLEAAAGIFA
jgi:uncharacterized membrane protein